MSEPGRLASHPAAPAGQAQPGQTVSPAHTAGTEERRARAVNGWPVVAGVVVALAAGGLLIWNLTVASIVAGALVVILAILACAGFFVVQPNEAAVLILFGRYIGTADGPGLWFANPFTIFWRRSISRRVRNFQSERSKVNDAAGSPIELAAVVVWRVVETAKAVFDVEDFEQFVVVQSETAIRHLASLYPYDDFEQGAPSLRGNADDVSRALHAELQLRLAAAGIEVIESRLTHLAYAPEIAEAMLRRQQASAIVAARRTIVQGAVGLVDMALDQISENGIVELDEERKAAMVSNLMVVLTGDRAPTPIINAGSLYH
jgi:regulator of protease activity HflC (stomatin/prohibitin superfamily)